MNILNFTRKPNTQKISQKPEEQLRTPISIEEQNSNKQTSGHFEKQPITNESITGTPFRIVNLPDQGWFVTLGMQRIGDIYITRQEALKPIRDKDWQLICNVIVTVIEQVNTIMKQEKPKQ